MPEDFDPEWEYAVVDPEIEWLFARNAQGVGGLSLINPEYAKVVDSGFRLGRDPRNVDTCFFKLARPKQAVIRESRPPKPVVQYEPFILQCAYQGCGDTFVTYHTMQAFCSQRCANKEVGRRQKADRQAQGVRHYEPVLPPTPLLLAYRIRYGLCKMCGEPVQRGNDRRGQKRQVCSDRCRYRWHLTSSRGHQRKRGIT